MTAALSGLGVQPSSPECPDLEALRFGKSSEIAVSATRHTTVGNPIKQLTHFRDKEGTPVTEITNYVFLTAVRPCRWHLRHRIPQGVGRFRLEGFRVLLFQQQGGLRQATGDASARDQRSVFQGPCRR
jgi:hypothetical protein